MTLTTPERDRLVRGFDDIHRLLEQVKRRYVVGLHHNWHDYALAYDPLFDFHLAGEEDLREVSGRHIPLVPMDACNFSPDCFHPGDSEKFWDILFVARAVSFKGIPEFFAAIRQLFDQGCMLRVLFICPVPPRAGPGSGSGSLRNVRRLYDDMFTSSEQDRFTLLTTDFRYPFPFDLPTLAHFYRSARVFVHSAPDERRCRVAAYAWATGMPVVGMAPVGSVLTAGLRRMPYFFETSSFNDFPREILRALDVARELPDFSEVQTEIAASKSVGLFVEHLDRLFSAMGETHPVREGWMHGLDIRLGRHHGLPSGTNRIDQDIGAFLEFIGKAGATELRTLLQRDDPELAIAGLIPRAPRSLAPTPGRAKAGIRRVLGALRRRGFGGQL